MTNTELGCCGVTVLNWRFAFFVCEISGNLFGGCHAGCRAANTMPSKYDNFLLLYPIKDVRFVASLLFFFFQSVLINFICQLSERGFAQIACYLHRSMQYEEGLLCANFLCSICSPLIRYEELKLIGPQRGTTIRERKRETEAIDMRGVYIAFSFSVFLPLLFLTHTHPQSHRDTHSLSLSRSLSHIVKYSRCFKGKMVSGSIVGLLLMAIIAQKAERRRMLRQCLLCVFFSALPQQQSSSPFDRMRCRVLIASFLCLTRREVCVCVCVYVCVCICV